VVEYINQPHSTTDVMKWVS